MISDVGLSQPAATASRGLESVEGGDGGVLSAKEIHRLRVIRLILEHRMTRVKACGLLGIGARQVIRLCGAYKREGAAGLVSRKRGRVGNRKLPPDVEARIVMLSRRLYQQMGPTLVREKLAQQHGIKLAKETVRRILSRAGLWVAKAKTAQEDQRPNAAERRRRERRKSRRLRRRR